MTWAIMAFCESIDPPFLKEGGERTVSYLPESCCSTSSRYLHTHLWSIHCLLCPALLYRKPTLNWEGVWIVFTVTIAFIPWAGLYQARYMSVGAPINVSTIEFFMGLNIPIMEIYGMSEGTVAQCLSTISNWRLGSVGQCINSVYLKINNPDEDGQGEVNHRFMY